MLWVFNNHYHFQGFASPTTTPVPDQLFDELLYHLSPTEIVVLLYIIRRTYGFKKQSDNISLNQMVNGITTKEGRCLTVELDLAKPRLLAPSTALRKRASLRASADVVRIEVTSQPPMQLESFTPYLKIRHPVSQVRHRPCLTNETHKKQFYKKQKNNKFRMFELASRMKFSANLRSITKLQRFKNKNPLEALDR